jgi:flagellar hook-length control protein FliK
LITDLANLGPSLRTTSGLEKNSSANKQTNSQAGKKPEAASSFGDILQQTARKAEKSPLRTSKDSVKSDNIAKPGPAPINENSAPKIEPTKAVAVHPNTSEPRTAPKTNNDWDETRSVQSKNQETNGEKSEEGQSAREVVMLKFMDSMESEFGIPPVKIVEAMTELPDEALLATPEDTAAQVIAQLDIPEDRKPEALALYMGLLAQLQMPAMNKPILPMPEPAQVAGGAAALAVMGKEERQASLNSSLDKMNSQFFMNSQPQMKPSMASDRLIGNDLGKGESPIPEMKDAVDWSQRENLTQKPAQDLFRAESSKANLSTKELAEQLQQMQAVDPNGSDADMMVQKLAALGMAAKALGNGAKVDPQSAQPLGLDPQSQQSGLMPQAWGLNAMAGQGPSSESQGDLGSDSGSDKGDSFFSGDARVLNHTAPTHADAKSNKFEFASMLGGAQVAGASKGESDVSQASIQQIMKQAQYMIKKGGGESKIQMSPDGLGQLHMKVVVNDGKVNLEMTAETKEAKKALESSLNDLKANLGQHKLTVEQVKVDVGNQLASDNRDSQHQQEQQRQMDMNRDQRNQQTREFWNEFQNQGQSRGAFQETPGIRAYGGARRDALTPNNSPSVSEKRFSGSGKGRGIDLVA